MLSPWQALSSSFYLDFGFNRSSAMFPLRLKTKLVLAITIMVVALVTTLSSIYISQLIKQRVDEAFQNGEFVASEVFQSTREALETDLANDHLDLNDPKILQSAIEES